MKIALCGYNWAGCMALRSLINLGYDVVVFTHEPPSYVPSLLDYSKKEGVEAYTSSINEYENIDEIYAICSIYYRNLISEKVLKCVNYRAMNLHPSLLPEYKGCSSLTWAMIEGEAKTGFSYHYIQRDFDTGNILLQEEIEILPFDLQLNLYQRVMFFALTKFPEALELLLSGCEGIPQENGGQYFYRGAPYNGQIDENWSFDKKERFIRAMVNPPLPYAKLGDKEIKSIGDLNHEDNN